ncbi:Ferredoxin fas2 [Hartmannibacter diazotrophicus]|uniref:Ferredoxin fas2 n=1 Tax=Hartmannibacter diazotrophicus TaxID=1482074 RepID=A0A2C9D4H4_9HYPH|nr:transketolase [Hartmannibacter diazotrophicus]SON54395.1 Ferredoxin fas2 [Hartmannibacter diazotrophicus]
MTLDALAVEMPKDWHPVVWQDASPEERAGRLSATARDVRRSVVRTIDAARAGHIGGDLSVSDILTTLFFSVLRLDPAHPSHPQRDRFILSKGHCAAALYSVLALRGFISPDLLPTFMKPLSALNGHPNRNKVPGVEANTGPLGHGLPIGVGSAIASRLSGANWQTFVVLGDGELQEGSNWEAAMSAGHRGLDNLVAIVDRNRLQQGARTEETARLDPLADKWRAFGWDAVEVDGHDHAALFEVFTRPRQGKPLCIVANTTKGKGVSFIEDRVEWHHKVPSPEQVRQALEELGQ